MGDVVEVPFSDLAKRPAQVAEMLNSSAALRLSRRDAEDLVLMSAARRDSEMEVMTVTARLLAELAAYDPAVLERFLPRVLPWVLYLPANDVDRLISDFVVAAAAAVDFGNVAPLAQHLVAWKHTAEIHADPDLYKAVTRPIEDAGPVPVPEADDG
ncbi:MAG: hypothetical protein J2P25_09375 [Nocardiopsaceae bacterium]|nr:hypothetical protein [Nocardiopsaceae bacterium]